MKNAILAVKARIKQLNEVVTNTPIGKSGIGQHRLTEANHILAILDSLDVHDDGIEYAAKGRQEGY